MPQILLRRPQTFGRQSTLSWLIVFVVLWHAISRFEPRNPALRADGEITNVAIPGNLIDGLSDVAPGRVPVHERRIPAPAAEQIVDRNAESLSLDVPQRHID